MSSGISKVLTEAGFDWVNIQDNFVSHERKADYGLMSNRMIVIARKK